MKIIDALTGLARKLVLSTGIAAVGVAGLAAPTTAFAEDALTKIRVGYIPVSIYTYLWRARDAGYFRDEKLDVELVPMAGGGQIIPALQAGALEFGISDALGVLNARNGGIPITFVSFNFEQTTDHTVHAVLTMDPDVKSAGDLKGKSVATNLSYNTDWVMMREWLSQEKVDPKSVTFREVPFPDMLAALRNKTVTAVGATEPFVTLGEKQGARVIGHFFTDVKSPIVQSGLISTLPYVEANKDITRRFLKAVNRAIDDIQDPAVAKKVIAANTKIDPQIIDAMTLGRWDKAIAPDTMQYWVDAAKKEGLISASSDLKDLVWQDK